MAAKLYYAIRTDENTGTTSVLGYYNSVNKLKKVLSEDKAFSEHSEETDICYFDVPKEVTEYINVLQGRIAELKAAAQDTHESYSKSRKKREV